MVVGRVGGLGSLLGLSISRREIINRGKRKKVV